MFYQTEFLLYFKCMFGHHEPSLDTHMACNTYTYILEDRETIVDHPPSILSM